MSWMDDVVCPYCEESFDLCHDDGAYYDENQREEAECPNCGKFVMIRSSMSWSHEAEKADCLNDGEHEWHKRYSEVNIKQVPGLAAEEECETCDQRRTVKL